jgi:hypothetical protein
VAESEFYMGRKRVESTAWPVFDSPLLAEIAAAFFRRRKAIAYKTGASGGLSCTREFSETKAGTHERLNLDIRGGHLRLSVWADGCLWLSVCVRAAGRNAGWAFQDAFHGDAGDVLAATLVTMVEATLELRLGAEPPAELEKLRSVWSRVHPETA